MNEIIFLAVQLGVTIAAFLIGKYVIPHVPKTAADKLNELSGWAAQFVVWARQFMQSSTGEEKMEKVVEMLNEIAVESGISVTEEQLKAIVQNAYEAMKAGEKELEAITMPVVQEAETVAASPTVNIFTGAKSVPEVTAVATDNVPDGALDVNEDGTVNVYDSDGKKTGTMTQEQAEEVQKKVTTIVIEESGK